MTPAQLRAFAAVVRHGSVKDAAAELDVTDAAVSGHVAQLRRELDDRLFTRSASGLAFTPGGLRLASRATEMLGLQDLTVREVSQAGKGRRMLRLAVTSLFAEYSAPGLIELFAGRADDLDVELAAVPVGHFEALLASRRADVAIGPTPRGTGDGLAATPFLRYQVVLVAGTGHPLAGARPRPDVLRDHTWLLGPSAAENEGAMRRLLRAFRVPEANQRIFQSHAAALEEATRGNGVAPSVAFVVADDLADGRLARVEVRGGQAEGIWSALTLPAHSRSSAAAELSRFVTTPRVTQAMLHGSGADVQRFRPSVHVTLWNG